MLPEHEVLDTQGSVTEGRYAWSWQQLKHTVAQPQGLQSNPNASGLLAEQRVPAHVLPGNPLKPSAVPEDQHYLEADPQNEEAAKVPEQTPKKATEDAEEAAVKSAGRRAQHAISGDTVDRGKGTVPLAEQLHMPLSPRPHAHSQQDIQNSPAHPSSPSAHSCPPSPTKQSAPAALVADIHLGSSNSAEVVHDHDRSKQAPGTDSETLIVTSSHDMLGSKDTHSHHSANDSSSNQEQCNSSLLSHDSRGCQEQNPEALVLSQALSLMPEHDPHDSDVLGEIPSGASSGLLESSPGLLQTSSILLRSGTCPLNTGQRHTGVSMRAPGTSSGPLDASLGLLGPGLEHLWTNATPCGPSAASLGTHPDYQGTTGGTSTGQAQTLDNARMGAEMLSLLASTHRQSVMPPPNWPFAPHFDQQHSLPGNQASRFGVSAQAPLLGSAVHSAVQNSLHRRFPGDSLCGSASLGWHPASGWRPLEQQVKFVVLISCYAVLCCAVQCGAVYIDSQVVPCVW